MRDWERSPTPEETWSDASGGNEHGEWPIEGIVGEEICLDGTSKYEVRWGNWSRADGSNTTWQTDIPDRPELVNRWKRKQRRKRVALAEDNLDMDVRWPEDTIHQRLTCQRAQGYEEKKQRRIPAPSTANWDQEVEVAYRRLDERSVEDSVPHLRVRRNASISSIASQRRGRTTSPALSTASRDILQAQSSPPITTPSRGRPRLDTLSSTSSRYGTQTRASSSTATPLRQASQTLSSAGQSDISWGSGRDVTDPPFSQTLCSRIASAWTRAARDVMAAAVRIDSNILDEAMPLSLRRFRYIEKGYVFDDGLEDIFEVARDVFTTCDCSPCSRASQCSCQVSSDIFDPLGIKKFAYSKGLFTFVVPRGAEVIECNKYCRCGRACQNRVVQRPRDVEIEIFDTKRCGFGARALSPIQRGKVVGTYTGKLVRREDIDKLPQEHHGYLFDLDCTEVKNEDNLGGKYTVDSYACGNWTRFVNHSCNPNMSVFSVVYDTIPDVNMPYIAFVACRDIPAGTELTIDYQPFADEDLANPWRHGAERCKCGTRQCRGWYRM